MRNLKSDLIASYSAFNPSIVKIRANSDRGREFLEARCNFNGPEAPRQTEITFHGMDAFVQVLRAEGLTFYLE